MNQLCLACPKFPVNFSDGSCFKTACENVHSRQIRQWKQEELASQTNLKAQFQEISREVNFFTLQEKIYFFAAGFYFNNLNSLFVHLESACETHRHDLTGCKVGNGERSFA
jgi:hypothetical protein